MKTTIKIPSQIKLKTEFFEGYGMPELIKSIVVLGLSSVVAYFIYQVTQTTLLATFLVIGNTSMSVVFLTKNRSGFSLMDNVKNIVKYELMQKEYRYERGNFHKKE